MYGLFFFQGLLVHLDVSHRCLIGFRFLRMTAFGMAALVMGIYLWLSWEKGTDVGSFLTLTLLGSAVICYLLTIYADRIGMPPQCLHPEKLLTLFPQAGEG
jgi:hypothetical protein